MSINLYPAFQIGTAIEHADDWNDDSTVNMANANFYSLVDHLKLRHLMPSDCGHIKVKTLRIALQTSEETRYHKRLNKICAIAEIKRVPFIAYS